MKRIVVGLLLAAAVLALTQCEVFFGREVKYRWPALP